LRVGSEWSLEVFDHGKRTLRLPLPVIGGEQPLRLTYSGVRNICCQDWSPDGQWISFARWDGDFGGVFIIPALGGPERKLADVTTMEGYLGGPTWTLDGKALLLGDRCVPDGPDGIVVFFLATGQKHCLTAPPSANAMDYGLNLSPDGRTVAFCGRRGRPDLWNGKDQNKMDIYVQIYQWCR